MIENKPARLRLQMLSTNIVITIIIMIIMIINIVVIMMMIRMTTEKTVGTQAEGNWSAEVETRLIRLGNSS